MNALLSPFRRLGAATINALWRLGFISRFFVAIVMNSGQSLLRFHLTIREIYYAGVLSLIIIVVSGLFVGMVLGLQGYNTLARFGSADALGALVALSLLRELGPVLAALLFASRSGSAMTAEIGLMKATEQLEAMSVMAVNPIARVVAPRFWAGVISMPILAALFQRDGHLRRLSGGCRNDRPGCRHVLVPDAKQCGPALRRDQRPDQERVFGMAVTLIAVFEGYDATPTAAGVSSATTRTVVTSALVILALDFVLTAFMF